MIRRVISLPKLWVFLMLILPYSLSAQEFTIYNTGIPGFYQGGSDWADYDGDGYLDVAISGALANNLPATRIYRNNAGTFQDINASLEGLKNGSIQWGDINNDGAPDLLVCGLDASAQARTLIYLNQNGTFTKLNTSFPGIYNGMARFIDFNNDGWLDIFLTGDTLSYNSFSSFYKNNGDLTFTPMDFGISGAISSMVSFGDYDNDGDVDLLLSGDIGGAYYTKLYRNDMGGFTEVPVNLEGLGAGWSLFFDLDRDGDLDIFLMGNDLSLTPSFKTYKNNGNGQFQEFFVGVTGLALGNIAIADYNNDGYPDFTATGKAPGCGAMNTVLYYNNKMGSFWQSTTSLIFLSYSFASWADFDNDGDNDLLLTGLNSSGTPVTRLYANTLKAGIFNPAFTPASPENLNYEFSGQDVVLRWSRPAGAAPGSTWSYNLRVGTLPGGMEIMAPPSNPMSGELKLYQMGNVTQDTFFVLKNLREGEYFWSVQAISPSFRGSSFAEEQSFSYNLTGLDTKIPDSPFTIGPIPTQEFLEVYAPQAMPFEIMNIDGKNLLRGQLREGANKLTLLQYPQGVYLIKTPKGIAKFMKQ
ncbi:MAG: FG-GAP repeat domain-containing protein [Bacteroidales bacterium]